MSEAYAEDEDRRRPLMIPRALAAWGDLGASVREEIEAKPSEPTAFAWLMIALALGGLAATPAEILLPAPGGEPMPGLAFATAVTLAPLFWFLLSALCGAAIRSMGGTLSYAQHRIVWFWLALVTMPVSLASQMLRLPAALAGMEMAADVVEILAAAAWLLVFVAFYRAAEDWGAILSNRGRFARGMVFTLLALGLVAGIIIAITQLAAPGA